MGDRVSIAFECDGEVSVALFSHWDGRGFVKMAEKYAATLRTDSSVTPLDRMEPGTVMVDFIRVLTKGKGPISSNYYLGATCKDGDNGDNGHWVVNLRTGKAARQVKDG